MKVHKTQIGFWAATWLLLCIYSIMDAQNFDLNPADLVNKNHAQRTIVLTPFYEEDLAFGDSTELFAAINMIEEVAKKHGDEELQLETELLRIHYFCYRDYFDKDFVVEKIKRLNATANQKNVDWLRIRTNSLLANYLYNIKGDYGAGFEYFERTAKQVVHVTPAEFPLKQICLYQTGAVYLEFKEYEQAKSYFLKALEASSEHDRYYYKMNLLNSTGLVYRNLNQLDSSTHYFEKIISEAKEHNDSTWIGIASGNLGSNYHIKGDLAKAEELINLQLSSAIKNEDWGLAAGAEIELAEINLKLKKFPRASQLCKSARENIHKSGRSRQLSELYSIMARLNAYKNNPGLSEKYLDSTLQARNTVAETFNSKILLRAKQRIELEKQDEHQRIRLRKKNNLLGFLVLLLIILGLSYFYYRQRQKNRMQRIEAEKESAITELNHASERLEDYHRSIGEKNRLIEKIKEDLQSNHSLKEKLDQAIISTEKDWRDFVRLFEKVHPRFFSNLQEKLPELTYNEKRILSLLKIEFSNNEMATALGVSADAIRQAKSRLRKKLQLSSTAELESVVANL